jgi:hypothetical protein
MEEWTNLTYSEILANFEKSIYYKKSKIGKKNIYSGPLSAKSLLYNTCD